MSSMTPQEIVHELDKHIVGQSKAKKAVADRGSHWNWSMERRCSTIVTTCGCRCPPASI